MANNVHLTPELERFAKSCVTSGRYNSVSEVVRSALRLLQEAEERRARFARMLDEVREEAEREGHHSVDEVLAEVDEILDRRDDPST